MLILIIHMFHILINYHVKPARKLTSLSYASDLVVHVITWDNERFQFHFETQMFSNIDVINVLNA